MHLSNPFQNAMRSVIYWLKTLIGRSTSNVIKENDISTVETCVNARELGNTTNNTQEVMQTISHMKNTNSVNSSTDLSLNVIEDTVETAEDICTIEASIKSYYVPPPAHPSNYSEEVRTETDVENYHDACQIPLDNLNVE